jgi:hypothetical protein
MPAGTIANPVNPHSNPDWSAGTPKKPSASPVLVNGLPLQAGTALTFGDISGESNNDVNYDPNVNYSPDGNTGWIVDNTYGENGGFEHGMADLTAPINAIVGVFLDDSQPDSTAAPSEALNFSTQASREFTSLSPKLKQPFFIGDGLTSKGAIQQFIVPQGATRLYVAQMDQYEWNNNRGSRDFLISRPGRVVLVQ